MPACRGHGQRIARRRRHFPPLNLQRNGQGDEMEWLFDGSMPLSSLRGCWKRCRFARKVLSNQASGPQLHLRAAQWLRQMLLHSVPRPTAAVAQVGMPLPIGAGFGGQAHSGDGGAAASEQGVVPAASGAARSAQAHSGGGGATDVIPALRFSHASALLSSSSVSFIELLALITVLP
jgi:hypothetical protein